MRGAGARRLRRAARRAAERDLHDVAVQAGVCALAEAWPDATPFDGSDAASALRLTGPYDVIAVSGTDDLPTIWRAVHPHLRPGGVFVARGGGLFEPSEDPEWAAMTGPVRSARGVTTVVKKGTHHVLVSHDEADQVLTDRRDPVRAEILQVLPAGDYPHAAQVTSHDTEVPARALLTTIEHPAQHLRHYTGSIVVANGSLVHSGHTILPDSFRYWAHSPTSKRMISSVRGFARLDAKRAPRERLEGDYYLLDSFFPGHFGHHVTEVLSRLWGWDQAKRRFPELKALYTLWGKDDREHRFETEMFTAFGIAPEDQVVVRKPVEVTSLVAASNVWHNQQPHFVHPVMEEIWTRLGDALADVPPEPPRRLFISRAEGKRGTRNLPEVEAYFRDHGFRIVYPEQLSLRDQAGLVQEAVVVAGLAGSAMFNVMYARRLEQMIVLGSDTYTARNEHLYASLLGGRLDYFWSPGEVQHPPNGWTQEAFTSSWTFDFARHQSALDALMDRIDRDIDPEGAP